MLFIKGELVIHHINANYMMNIIPPGKVNGEKRLMVNIQIGLTILLILKKLKFHEKDLHF